MSIALSSIVAIDIAFAIIPVFSGRAEAQMGGGMREMMQRMMPDRLPPGIDPALLPDPQSAGAKALERYCIQCHNLPGPGMHTAAEWPAVVGRMEARMRRMTGTMGGIAAPTHTESDALLRYLRAHAQQPIDPKRYSDLDSPTGRSFQATCAQCHAPPDPGQHTAAQRPDVVARMRRNMSAMGRAVPDNRTLQQILGFLESHARR